MKYMAGLIERIGLVVIMMVLIDDLTKMYPWAFTIGLIFFVVAGSLKDANR